MKISLSTPTRIRANKPSKPCFLQTIIDLCSNGKLQQAVDSLDLLARRGIRIERRTLAFLLQQCASSKSLAQGKLVHLHLKLSGRKDPKIFLSNHLINMYFECGSSVDALKVFDKMPQRNVFSWNNLLAGYAKSGMLKAAWNVFHRMPQRDVVSWNTMVIGLAKNGWCDKAVEFYAQLRRLCLGFNQFSFSGVLIACVKLQELRLSQQVHGQVLVAGFASNLVIASSIVDAYAKCGSIDEARKLFDEMPIRDTLAWTTLVSGYATCGDLESAQSMFLRMPEKNSVSWTALISGYARNGMGSSALDLFTEMMVKGVKPDQFTFSSCLSACASVASLKHGKQIHARLIRTGFRPNAIVVSSLIDMYSKCGNLEVAQWVFALMGNKKDIVLHNTMIAAFAQHGHAKEAIQLFEEIMRAGTKPDGVTFVVILLACSHSGLVQEGIQYFKSMTRDHNIFPGQEHYACLVDLLGRAERFNEAIDWIEKMPFDPDVRVWNSLLGACRIHGKIELGAKVAERLIELDPTCSAAYVLLSNIYAASGRWESMEKVRQLMSERQVRKQRAISWIEVEAKVHTFSVSDLLHPSKQHIYAALEQLASQMEVDSDFT